MITVNEIASEARRKPLVLGCLLTTALLTTSAVVRSAVVNMMPPVSANTYNATVSGTDQQTVKGFGGALPWYKVGTPINDHPLAAQAVVDMSPDVIRITWHNIYDVYGNTGAIVNTTLMDTMVSQIKWAASHKIAYQLSPGWNCLPRSCYDDKGILLPQYEQAMCDSVKNTLKYFTSHGCALPIMTTLANEPNVPIGWMSPVPVPQFQRVYKRLRATLNSAGFSNLKLGYAENGEVMYSLKYLGGPGFPDLDSDPALNSSIDAFVTHTYYPNKNTHQPYADGIDAKGNGRDRWQTEYCYNGDQIKAGLDQATGLTERFISDMAFLKVNYWEYWQLWNTNGPAGTDTLTAKIPVVKPPAYYVLKRIWSNVPPGSRVRRVTTDDPGLMDDNNAFMDTIAFVDTSKMVVIFVNPTATARGMNVNGLTGTSASVYQIATNAPDNTEMTLAGSPTISGGTASNINLAAHSVTVIVTNGGSVRSASTPVATSTPASGLLTNPGFESGSFVTWSTYGTASVQTTNAHAGTYSALLTNKGSGVARYEVAVSPNTTYTVKAWGREGADGNLGRLYAKTALGGADQYVEFTSTTWTQKQLTFTTGATDKTCEIGVWLTTDGTFYVDDLELVSNLTRFR